MFDNVKVALLFVFSSITDLLIGNWLWLDLETSICWHVMSTCDWLDVIGWMSTCDWLDLEPSICWHVMKHLKSKPVLFKPFWNCGTRRKLFLQLRTAPVNSKVTTKIYRTLLTTLWVENLTLRTLTILMHYNWIFFQYVRQILSCASFEWHFQKLSEPGWPTWNHPVGLVWIQQHWSRDMKILELKWISML